MAKRKRNMSKEVREYLEINPDESTAVIAKKLRVKPTLVYNVKSTMKAKGTGRGKRRGPKQVSLNGSPEHVVAAAKLIRACGGASEARLALRAAEQVAAALEA